MQDVVSVITRSDTMNWPKMEISCFDNILALISYFYTFCFSLLPYFDMSFKKMTHFYHNFIGYLNLKNNFSKILSTSGKLPPGFVPLVQLQYKIYVQSVVDQNISHKKVPLDFQFIEQF